MDISLREAADMLLAAHKLVITSHVNPDGDAIGSCLGLKFFLEGLGKEVTVLIDDDIPDNLKMLPGIEAIERPVKDVYTGDYLVMLDVTGERTGCVIDKCKLPVINIDHHISNNGTADFRYLDAKRAATAEIIYELVKEVGGKFDLNSATALYTGIATDTGYFRFSNTTPFTMRAEAELMEYGIHPELISQALETRRLSYVQNLAKALQTIEIDCQGRVAGIYLDYSTVSKMDSTEGFIDAIRVIDGVDVAVLLREKEPGVCRISMRSKETDVSVIAAGFGGGGHIRAAGCTISGIFAGVKAMLLAGITREMEKQ